MTETDEKVLCIPKTWADEVMSEDRKPDARLYRLCMYREFRNRHTPNDNDPDVEHDDRWKQLIPYIVVVNSKGQILAFNRGSKGGEKRLESKWSIGFGGHVNDQDESFAWGIWREIREELTGVTAGVDAVLLHGPIGFLNDDSDAVGRVHLGVVYVLRADEVTPREVPEFEWWHKDYMQWLPVHNRKVEFENWSVLALPMVRAWMESEGK